jgi:hypothetical protein
MLEVRENWAHLKDWLIWFQAGFTPPAILLYPWDFVRELFTIRSIRVLSR